MNQTQQISPLAETDLKTIIGGGGVFIDPNGNPGSSGNGDEGTHIDPNG